MCLTVALLLFLVLFRCFPLDDIYIGQHWYQEYARQKCRWISLQDFCLIKNFALFLDSIHCVLRMLWSKLPVDFLNEMRMGFHKIFQNILVSRWPLAWCLGMQRNGQFPRQEFVQTTCVIWCWISLSTPHLPRFISRPERDHLFRLFFITWYS